MSHILTLATFEQATDMQQHSNRLHAEGHSVFGYYDLDGFLPPADRRRLDYEKNLLARLKYIDKVHMGSGVSERTIGELVINEAFGLSVQVSIFNPENFI